MEDPRTKSTCLSCASRGIPSVLPTPVAVIVTVHQAPTAPSVPIHSPAVHRVTRLHPTGEGRHEERELAARTPVASRSRAGTPFVQSVEYVGEFPTGLQPFNRIVRGRPSSQLCKGGSDDSLDDEINTPIPIAKAATPAQFLAMDDQEGPKRHRFLTPIVEATPSSSAGKRHFSGTRFITQSPARVKKEAAWGVDRDHFRGIRREPPDRRLQGGPMELG